MNKEIIYYDNKNLNTTWFTYTWLNKRYEHVYKFRTPKWVTSTRELKKIVVEKFNKNKASNCPAIHEDDVVTQWGKTISGSIIPDSVSVHIPSN